jgi:hypothetical protein
MRLLSAFRHRPWTPVIALLFVLVARPAEAQGERPPATDSTRRAGVPLVGDVIDAVGRPLADVEIALVGTNLRTRTDARGFWMFRDPPTGAYVLTARRLGYAPINHPINVFAGVADTVNLATARLNKLTPVQVQSTMDAAGRDATAMAERLLQIRVSTGRLLTRDDILARKPAGVVDLIQGVPGILAQRTARGISVATTRAGTGAMQIEGQGCQVQFFLNRQPVDVEDIQSLSPLQFRSVEIYPNTSIMTGLPMMSGKCGAVVITMM